MSEHVLSNKLYSYHLTIAGISEYGVSFERVAAGEAVVPPSGARFDVRFEGAIEGKINGTVQGCDYLYVRPDGRMELHVRAEITTDDGATIALQASGVGWPVEGTPLIKLRENATLFTAHEKYAWVNGQQVWAPGQVDLAEGVVDVTGYGH